MTISKFAILDYYNTKTPPGLSLFFANSQFGAVVWDARLFDLETREWVSGDPGGIKTLDQACRFDTVKTRFLLSVMEWPGGGWPGPYWLGPYLVTVPILPGSYTWDSKNGTIDGVPCPNLPFSPNASQIVGTIQDIGQYSSGWGITLRLQSSAPGVYVDPDTGESFSGDDDARYFISTPIVIVPATLPLDELGHPVLSVGDVVTCTVMLAWAGYSATWYGQDYRYPRTYPDSYYQFTGSLIPRQLSGVVPNAQWAVDYTITGIAPQFAIVAVERNIYGYPVAYYKFIGSGKGTFTPSSSFQPDWGWSTRLEMYAHPNPSPPDWSVYTWRVNNWQRVA